MGFAERRREMKRRRQRRSKRLRYQLREKEALAPEAAEGKKQYPGPKAEQAETGV